MHSKITQYIYFSWTVVSSESLLSILISPDTKQYFYFSYLTNSKSDVLLNAYPLIWSNFNKWFVTCLPAISNLSNLALIMLPSETGNAVRNTVSCIQKQCSHNTFSIQRHQCLISIFILLTWKSSNMISIIPALLAAGFMIASVKKTELPLGSVTPILKRIFHQIFYVLPIFNNTFLCWITQLQQWSVFRSLISNHDWFELDILHLTFSLHDLSIGHQQKRSKCCFWEIVSSKSHFHVTCSRVTNYCFLVLHCIGVSIYIWCLFYIY